jgi:hypothetical protein
MSVSKQNRTVKSSLRPTNLSEINAVEAIAPGFIARVDKAICALYKLRALRQLIAELPPEQHSGAAHGLNYIEEIVCEPLIEWWCRTRAQRWPQYPEWFADLDCDPSVH